jgi:transposase
LTTRGSRRLRRADPKVAALQATGTLNRRLEAVTDPLFRTGGLFDPRDLLQVRYEMVRRHLVEDEPVAATAQLFGVSLPTAYQAYAAFKAGGLAALLTKRRGPKHGHKLTPEVLSRERPNLRAGDLVADLQHTFGLTIHRRSLERMLTGQKNFRATERSMLLRRCGWLREVAQLRPKRDACARRRVERAVAPRAGSVAERRAAAARIA